MNEEWRKTKKIKKIKKGGVGVVGVAWHCIIIEDSALPGHHSIPRKKKKGPTNKTAPHTCTKTKQIVLTNTQLQLL